MNFWKIFKTNKTEKYYDAYRTQAEVLVEQEEKKIRKPRTYIWALPILAAVFAGSCADPYKASMTQYDKDIRSAICAFTVTFFAIIIIRITGQLEKK